jgi:hypothetical protein
LVQGYNNNILVYKDIPYYIFRIQGTPRFKELQEQYWEQLGTEILKPQLFLGKKRID